MAKIVAKAREEVKPKKVAPPAKKTAKPAPKTKDGKKVVVKYVHVSKAKLKVIKKKEAKK